MAQGVPFSLSTRARRHVLAMNPDFKTRRRLKRLKMRAVSIHLALGLADHLNHASTGEYTKMVWFLVNLLELVLLVCPS